MDGDPGVFAAAVVGVGIGVLGEIGEVRVESEDAAPEVSEAREESCANARGRSTDNDTLATIRSNNSWRVVGFLMMLVS